jgi:hypothetical protein
MGFKRHDFAIEMTLFSTMHGRRSWGEKGHLPSHFKREVANYVFPLPHFFWPQWYE